MTPSDDSGADAMGFECVAVVVLDQNRRCGRGDRKGAMPSRSSRTNSAKRRPIKTDALLFVARRCVTY